MSDLRKEKTPDELYREYQNSRDDIPPATLNVLISAAQQARHEDTIHLLLQKAKVIEAGREGNSVQKKQDKSLTGRLRAMLFPRLSNGWGVAFAGLAMAVIALPLMIDRGSSPFLEVAHLQDCSECASYISDAAVVTRSTVPGLNPLHPDARIASKLGRIRANLMIASVNNDATITNTSIRELSKFGSIFANSEVDTLINSSQPSADDLAMALSMTTQAESHAQFFKAAQSLQLALITVAANRPDNGAQDIAITLDTAINAYTNISERSELQDTVLEQLDKQRQGVKSGDLSERAALQQLITRALQSLGA